MEKIKILCRVQEDFLDIRLGRIGPDTDGRVYETIKHGDVSVGVAENGEIQFVRIRDAQDKRSEFRELHQALLEHKVTGTVVSFELIPIRVACIEEAFKAIEADTERLIQHRRDLEANLRDSRTSEAELELATA